MLRESRPANVERLEARRGKYTIEAWLLKPADFDPASATPSSWMCMAAPTGTTATLQRQPAESRGQRLPRGDLQSARLYLLRARLHPAGDPRLGRRGLSRPDGSVDTVLRRPYADPERTGIYGYSYGGYMTSWTISQTQRFKAAVCGAPCFDLESMFGTSDIGSTFGIEQWGGTPAAAREWYAAHSPSTYAHQTRTPTLIVHGEADERCPIGQSEQMFATLKRAGCEVEFVRYPGGSHLFLRGGPSEHREDFYTRVSRLVQVAPGRADRSRERYRESPADGGGDHGVTEAYPMFSISPEEGAPADGDQSTQTASPEARQIGHTVAA